MSVPGPVLFARYAYPPNALGYCGPGDAQALLEYAHAATTDGGLIDLARRFDGAWPYLALIAAYAGIADPLDRRVVEAYWTGSPLLDLVPGRILAAHVDGRFRRWLRPSPAGDLAETAATGRPHHMFHVFSVYPWVGMMRAGHVIEPLRVLDSCRIRWGTVIDLAGEDALISSQPLVWSGRDLALGPHRPERVRLRRGGYGLAVGVRTGDVVSAHWDWVCDVLTDRQVARLAGATAEELARVHTAPAAVGSLCG